MFDMSGTSVLALWHNIHQKWLKFNKILIKQYLAVDSNQQPLQSKYISHKTNLLGTSGEI